MATFTVSRLDYEEDAGYVVQSTDAVQVAVGSPGPTGPTGATGPNNISGSTTTSLSGFLTGSSGVVKVTNLSSGLSLLYDSNTDSFLLGNSDRGSVAVTSHLAASDPHPQYTTETELTTALSGYALTSAVPGLAPVQSVAGRTGAVTIVAADVTDSTATGRAVLTAVSQAAARTAIGAGVGDAVTSGTLAQFAATTSAQLAGVLSDETGSGAAVFGTGPTLTSPVIAGSASTGILFGGSASSDVLLRKNAAVGGTPNLAVYSGDVGAWGMVSAATFRAGTDGIIWTAGGTGQWAALNDAQSAFVGVKGSNLTATALVNLGVYTVATLPIAASNASAIATVTDSNSTTNGATVAGGGSNRVPVFSNGTNWIIK